PASDRVIFRWQGVPCSSGADGSCMGGAPVNFEIELQSSGKIITRYGGGNINLYPVVGIAGGEPEPYVVTSHSSEVSPLSLTNAQAVTFTPNTAATKADQSISFDQPSNKTFGDAPFTLSAAGGASGNPVTFGAGPANVCNAGGANGSTITINGAGVCTVTASQAGNANFNDAPGVSRSFTVNKASQTISFGPLPNKTYGDAPFTLSAAGGASGNPVTFGAGPANVCNAGGTNNATINITGAGTCTVTASQAGNANFNDAPGLSQSLTVNKANQTVSFGPLANRTFGDAPFTVNASSSSALPVTFSIASGPATVSGNTVTLNAAGTVVVRASQDGNSNYNAAPPVDQSFTVATSGPCSFVLTPANLTLGPNAQTGSVAVSGAGTCNWSATANASWISVNSGASSTGNGAVGFSVAANTTNAQRSGAISIAGQSFVITQAAGPAPAQPADDPLFFVREHYLDFLGREPDDGGLGYWSEQIKQCGTDAACLNDRRIGVSAAFFIELEFQQTGSVVYRLYRAAYGNMAAPNQ
ncbi:MAG TPA: BACON domain-containing carbohydrate-binding protein, partial [Pyrinomonadaceae bacterium]